MDNSAPQPLPISTMRESILQFEEWKNILNQTAHKQAEKKEILNEIWYIMNDFKSKLRITSDEDEELIIVKQLRKNLERLTKKNMKPKTQQLAFEQPLDLTKSSRQTNQLLGRETPKVSPIIVEMPTGASVATLTPRLSQTLNRLVETPLQSQPQQGGSTQTTTTTVQSCAVKRALPAQNSPPLLNQSSDNVEEQPEKKMKVDMNVIRERLDERTIVVNGIEFVIIGANNTKVLKKFLLDLNWYGRGEAITRKLLSHLFDHKTLATHTMTGKPSPAFLNMNKPQKGQLNQLIVLDIIEFMLLMTDLTAKDVKTSITTKCADESKKLRRSLSTIAVAEVTSSDLHEKNVAVPEVVSSDLNERDVISGPEVTSSN